MKEWIKNLLQLFSAQKDNTGRLSELLFCPETESDYGKIAL